MFSRAGDVKRIIMGLDKHQMTPCGFAFVVYYTRQDAEDAVKYISGTIMDDRPVRVDFDWGFKDGRQYGRGRSGGQVQSLLSRSHIIAVRSWCAQAGDHAPQACCKISPCPKHTVVMSFLKRMQRLLTGSLNSWQNGRLGI